MGFAKLFVQSHRSRGIATSQCKPGYLENPNAAIERNRNHIPTFNVTTGCNDTDTVDPHAARHSHRSIRCRSADTGRPPSAAFLGVRLELGLEGRKLGKRGVGVGLLLALATRDVVAAVLGRLAAVFSELRPLAA